jgi:hypothetical protein
MDVEEKSSRLMYRIYYSWNKVMTKASRFFFMQMWNCLGTASVACRYAAGITLCVVVSFVTSCGNLELPLAYDRGPCGDNVDTTSVNTYIFTMPRTDVVVRAGTQQQFWTTIEELSCTSVRYTLSKALGSVDASGLYTAPTSLATNSDSVWLYVQSYAKRSLMDTVLIVVEKKYADCTPDAVTYSGTIEPLMQEHCTGCHSSQSYTKSGGGVLLETYADVRRSALEGRLLATIDYVSPYKMPKNSLRLDSCSIEAVRSWIVKGAPND